MRRRLPPARLAALALACTAALALWPASPAGASVKCSMASANRLLVDPYESPFIDLDFADATIRRAGNRILVLGSPFDPLGKAIECEGPKATVFNVDTVDVLSRGLSFVNLDLSGGTLAPGATPEPDGSDEVEVRFGTDIDALGYGIVTGTEGPDRWRISGTSKSFGIALDPLRPDEQDVIYNGLGIAVAVAETGDGADLIDASGLAGGHAVTILEGGKGPDTLLGSAIRDSISGGRGPDTIDSGPGSDRVDARDRFRDKVECGGGKDSVRTDRHDRPHGCEEVSRPRRHHHPPKPL